MTTTNLQTQKAISSEREIIVMNDSKWSEVFAAISAIISLFIAFKAYEISELQANISKNSLLPNIQIKTEYVNNESSNELEDTIIEISNLDGKINNYNSRIITYLKCDYLNNNYDYYSVNIPVSSYYYLNFNSDNNIGVLETKHSLNNSTEYYNLYNDVLKWNSIDANGTLGIELESCLEITYLDLLGEKQQQYYIVGITNSNYIEESEARKIFFDYESLCDENIYVDFNIPNNITAEQLTNKIITSYNILDEKNSINLFAELSKTFLSIETLQLIAYVFSRAFQISGAVIVLFYGLSSKRKSILQSFFANSFSIKSSDTNEIEYDHNALVETYRTTYLNKFAFTYIIIGYSLDIFGKSNSTDNLLTFLIIILVTSIFIFITVKIVNIIIIKSNEINKVVNYEELIENHLNVNLEEISDEEIENTVKRNIDTNI